MRDRERERQRHRQREKQAPCAEPDVGLDPRIPESYPEPKADAQPLSHPGVLDPWILNSHPGHIEIRESFSGHMATQPPQASVCRGT